MRERFAHPTTPATVMPASIAHAMTYETSALDQNDATAPAMYSATSTATMAFFTSDLRSQLHNSCYEPLLACPQHRIASASVEIQHQTGRA